MSAGPPTVLIELRPLSELRPHQHTHLPLLPAAARAALRDDIGTRGIVEPLEITTQGVVLNGRERFRAATELGLSELPIRIVHPRDEVEHIILAALQRRHLSASQRAALALELDRYRELREQATTRRRSNLRQYAEAATLPPRGKTRDHVAAWAGVSARTVQDAATVQQHDRDLFERIKAGEIHADLAARKVRRALRDANIAAAPPLPEGPFELIYADPPWQLGNPDGQNAPEDHYPTLPLAAIKDLQPAAADNAALFLWAVNCLLPQALEVITSWGFSYKTNLVWVKPTIGLGYWTRNRHELLLFATRGHLELPEPKNAPGSVIEAGRGRHSQKPALVYELIERAYPHLSKLELFARGKPRRGWQTWGNQAEQPASPAQTE
jgi:N6-adenosine-specific RNA methylase IME4/ParB-like chromosome segregation protein Spo0J